MPRIKVHCRKKPQGPKIPNARLFPIPFLVVGILVTAIFWGRVEAIPIGIIAGIAAGIAAITIRNFTDKDVLQDMWRDKPDG